MSGVVMYYIHKYAPVWLKVPVLTVPAVSLSKDMNTNNESLTERTINKHFIILFEKTTVKNKYIDTQSSSIQPVQINSAF